MSSITEGEAKVFEHLKKYYYFKQSEINDHLQYITYQIGERWNQQKLSFWRYSTIAAPKNTGQHIHAKIISDIILLYAVNHTHNISEWHMCYQQAV